MKKESNLTIITILCSILAIFSIVLGFQNYNKKLSKELEAQATYDLTNSSNQTIHTINSKVNDIITNLYNVADTLIYNTIDVNNSSFKTALKERSYKNELGYLSVYAKDTLLSLIEDNDITKEDRLFIQELLNGESQVQYLNEANDCFRQGITISIPIIKNNKVIGALNCNYTVKEFSLLLSLSTFDGNGTATIIYPDGSTIASMFDTNSNIFEQLTKATFLSNITLETLVTDITKKSSGILHFTHNKKGMYAQYSPLEISNWYLYNEVPANVIEAKSNKVTSLASNLTSFIVVVFLLLIMAIIGVQTINNMKLKNNQDIVNLEKERYRLVLEHSQGVIWEYDIQDDTLHKTDKDIGIYTGLTVLPSFKECLLNLGTIHPDDVNIFSKFCDDLKSGQKDIHAELRAKDISDKFVWFEFDGTTVYDAEDKPISVIGQTLNIDSKRRAFEELRDHAQRDSLTKLFNRSTTVSMIDAYLDEVTDPLMHALFMIDIDNFKSINDTLGHIFGDAVLVELSSKLNRELTGKSFAGRIGGDEFVVFLYDIPSLNYVEEKAQQICNIFKEIYTGDNNNLLISGSIGISIYPNNGDDFKTLFEKADRALYFSKRLGKDCFSIYSNDTMKDMIAPTNISNETKDSPLLHDDKSFVDTALVANTIDILFDSREINASINMILSVIGNYFNLSRISIIEYTYNFDASYLSYQWAENKNDRISPNLQYIPIEMDNLYSFYKLTENYVYYCSNLLEREFPDNYYANEMKRTDTRSLLQCGIVDGGQCKAYMTFSNCHNTREWTKNEIDTLTILSKIIGGYILKLRSQEEASHISEHDILTDSYNVFKFNDEAAKLIDANQNKTYAVLYSDVDKFKFINENYGYSVGDDVLIKISNIYRNSIMENEVFGRVNADKFVALLEYDENFNGRLDTLLYDFNHIPKTDSDYYKLSVIVGVYVIEDKCNMSLNIDRANIARKNVTERHKSTYNYFDESMKSTIVKQKEIEDIMEDALRDGQFVVYYQPKFDLISNQICGAEALVRWNRPDIGLIPPGEFVPVFEENGFITEIDFFVFERVCQRLVELTQKGIHPYPISVNFSRVHLKNNHTIDRINRILTTYNTPPNLIEIEITESALIDNDIHLITMLHELRSLGIKLSMDDFGSGLSSLNLLRKLPFDIIKLDKDFFQNSKTTDRERLVITNVVKLAKDLNMEIISEGVETKDQVEFLKEIECHKAQGFYFAKPMDESSFESQYL